VSGGLVEVHSRRLEPRWRNFARRCNGRVSPRNEQVAVVNWTEWPTWQVRDWANDLLEVVVVVMTSLSGTAYMGGGDKNVPKRLGNPPDSESGGICLSLMIVDSHFIDWGTTQGRLLLPTDDVLSTIVKRLILMNVDKLSSCSRFSDSVVGFTGQTTQPTASKYWRSNLLAWGRQDHCFPDSELFCWQLWQRRSDKSRSLNVSWNKSIYTASYTSMSTGCQHTLGGAYHSARISHIHDDEMFLQSTASVITSNNEDDS